MISFVLKKIYIARNLMRQVLRKCSYRTINGITFNSQFILINIDEKFKQEFFLNKEISLT